jgi:hypothetical protein
VVLTVPALEWLLAPGAPQRIPQWQSEANAGPRGDRLKARTGSFSRPIRLSILALLLTATLVQAIDFQITFWREEPKRLHDFDVPYKPLYEAAVAQPQRPIYLENSMWGPAYMDAYWYATVEGRPLSEFIRLSDRAKPAPGAIVLRSNSDCQNCEIIQKSGFYELYRAK